MNQTSTNITGLQLKHIYKYFLMFTTQLVVYLQSFEMYVRLSIEAGVEIECFREVSKLCRSSIQRAGTGAVLTPFMFPETEERLH